jgi:hypothetical protein
MIVDGFGSGIGSSMLVSIFLSYVGQQPLSFVGQQPLTSMGNNPCPLWDNNPCRLWDNNPYRLWVTTLILCGMATLVLYGTHHPLWLPFRLIGWFGLWLGFRLGFGDSLGQGCEATIWVVWFAWQPSIPSPLMN